MENEEATSEFKDNKQQKEKTLKKECFSVAHHKLPIAAAARCGSDVGRRSGGKYIIFLELFKLVRIYEGGKINQEAVIARC